MLDLANAMELLIQFSEDKYNLIEKAYQLTKEQTEAIEDEDIDKLNELISKKQLQIDMIRSLDEKFEKIVNQLKQEYDVKEVSEINQCQEEIKRVYYIKNMINNKLQQMNDVDLNNRNALKMSKDYLDNKIKSLKVGKKAVSGYGCNIKVPVYFDKNK